MHYDDRPSDARSLRGLDLACDRDCCCSARTVSVQPVSRLVLCSDRRWFRSSRFSEASGAYNGGRSAGAMSLAGRRPECCWLPSFFQRARTMDTFTTNDLWSLTGSRAAPCISIHMPTHVAGAERQQDPLRLKSLLQRAEEQLEEKWLRRRVGSQDSRAGASNWRPIRFFGSSAARARHLRVTRDFRPLSRSVAVGRIGHRLTHGFRSSPCWPS